jgi:hypothetical protein
MEGSLHRVDFPEKVCEAFGSEKELFGFDRLRCLDGRREKLPNFLAIGTNFRLPLGPAVCADTTQRRDV